jgi:hypothetical protein
LRALISADAQLRAANDFAGRMADAPYLGEYERAEIAFRQGAIAPGPNEDVHDPVPLRAWIAFDLSALCAETRHKVGYRIAARTQNCSRTKLRQKKFFLNLIAPNRAKRPRASRQT